MNEPKENAKKIPRRILANIITSVSAGVVPRSGAPYIAIGRKDEIGALLSDLRLVSEGGGSMRFLIGRYGSGKSFLMQLIRGYALEEGFLTADCDLSPERRLYGTGGAGLRTYRELIKNLASSSSPDGDALPKLLARWIFDVESRLVSEGITRGGEGFDARFEKTIAEDMKKFEFMTGGFDFARVTRAYRRAVEEDNPEAVTACLRWFRGEFSTRSEARRALGFDVSMVVDDANWYDFIKLWAEVGSVIGYRGLIVFIDECVNLYKIPHRVSRENNYEKILSMFNDTLQGRAPHLGIIFGGTPQFLEDTRRGLFGYEALRSRLASGRFAKEGELRDLSGPVIRLKRLSDDELLALITRMTSLHSIYYSWEPRITPDETLDYLKLTLARAGADSMITPREMLRDYMSLLSMLHDNPEASYGSLVSSGKAQVASAADTSGSPGAGAFDPGDFEF
ncbi:MAG: ATP-binding protein [Clostridia bacterium]|nr:ATP-binding protein [Clostridia bacterium]